MEQAQQGQAMTLREKCEAFLTKYGLGGLKSQAYEEAKQESTFIQDLERLCLKQQAVGLREAGAMTEQHHAKDHWYMQWVREQCEQRARELEKA